MFFQKSACSQSLSPNPFPVVKGCVCLVGFASCKALGHTRPASVPGLSVGLPPSPRLGLRPKPHFQKLYRFFGKLKATGNNLCGFDLFMGIYAFFSLVCLNIIFITPVFARANMRTDAISAPPTVLTPKGIT